MVVEYPQSSRKWSAAVAAPSIKQFKPQSGIRTLVNPRSRHDNELSTELRIAGGFRKPHKPIRLLLKEFHFLRGHLLRSIAQTRQFPLLTQMLLARAKPLFPQRDWMKVHRSALPAIILPHLAHACHSSRVP
jgi:hypothetical protein